MRYSKTIFCLLVLLTITQAGYIESVMGSYWDYSNAEFATAVTLTFRLENGLPTRGFMKVTLPSSMRTNTASVEWRKYDSNLATMKAATISSTTTTEINLSFEEELLAN